MDVHIKGHLIMASVFKRGGKNNRGGPYYIQWKDHNGRRQTKCANTTDKASAERIAKKLEADAALRRDGVIDPALDAISKESQRTIDAHLADFEAKMRAAGRSDDHVERTTGLVRKISTWAELTLVGDISADGVNRYASMLRDKNRGARTIASHLTAIKSFTRWLTEHHKLPRDPLASVKKPNPKTDRRLERRILLPEEWHHLRDAALAAPDRGGMPGTERVMLYKTAIQTGLRSGELRSLTRGRLYVDRDDPYVACKSRSTKNSEDAYQYIQPELADDLKAHIALKSPTAPVFNLPHETDMAHMFRGDLADSRNAWLQEARNDPDEYCRREQSDFLADTNHNGERIDFHSLRHTCGAWLAGAGVQPKVVQSLMRHSSITLTMDTYGHLFPGQEADAVRRMREMFNRPSHHVLRATGTDDANAGTPNSAQHLAQHSGRETVQRGANACETGDQNASDDESRKSLVIASLCEGLQGDATGNENRPGGPSTSVTSSVFTGNQLVRAAKSAARFFRGVIRPPFFNARSPGR